MSGLFLSSSAYATMTLVSITGASNTDLTDLTKPKVYAGFAGTCTEGMDNSNTCNSCTGADVSGSKFWPCNPNNAYVNLNLVIRTSFTATSVGTATPFVKIGSGSKLVTFVQTIENGGTILNTQIPWGQLCSSAVAGNTNCETPLNEEITVGIDFSANGSAATTESFSFRVQTRFVDSTTPSAQWFYTDCGDDASTAASNSGFCHFKAYPGDEKIYADPLVLSSTELKTGITGVDYTNLVFFTEAGTSETEADTDIIARMSNKSSMTTKSITTSVTPPSADNRISGLSNGIPYCVVMANQDATGIISFFTPLPGTSGGVTVASMCTIPSQVVGLLDDKKCFIATAAFGSDMAPEVQSFRDFRNKYLLSHSWGRAFVKMYYKYSPFYAHLIAESEVSKFIVRLALWPLLLFARMSVALGFWVSFLILSAGAFSLVELYRRLILGRKFRGEL